MPRALYQVTDKKLGKFSEFFTFGPWAYLTESNYFGTL